MNEWHDILSCLRNKQLVWFSQCSQLFNAIAAQYIEQAECKENGLMEVATEGDLNGVKYLVERCEADLHSWNHGFVLFLASGSGHLEVVRYLVEKGADVHALDEFALRFASNHGRLEVVRYLVEEGGADVHAGQENALHYASNNGHIDVVEYLKSKGATQ